ncbi:efflux RND transporter permease subunit [Pelotomaculum propionicicum]|uniref:Multidrug export protein AcrF n=1 Tax=Pelotomaculum propionicicum TaxID=258475 RepID=A0A4Y7RTJ2_9FIRM|nr:efflux RND transporter permease subunit [Pelotomaculum propionicicum]TEB12191.1 Multidrug export protein AcrF [Pelotomaculum propionicicum]
MSKFNLAELALKKQQLVYFFIVVIFTLGALSYQQMGRSEDPDFVIRQMVIATAWPGATEPEVEEQVTYKIERKLQETPGFDKVESYSMPGQSVIFLSLKYEVKEGQLRPTWQEVRNMVNDVAATFPKGVLPPVFNDRFDDVYGNIYALTAEGFTHEEVRQYAEEIRQKLLGVKNVAKVELVGVQPEKIFVEIESSKLAQLGVDQSSIIQTLQSQNAVAAAGMLETSSDNVYLRVSGIFENIDNIRNLAIRANNSVFRLGDIATVRRGYAEPAQEKMFYNGRQAVGLAISMEKGGNILTMGDDLAATVEDIRTNLPLGMEIHQVANQPEVVKNSINEFVKTLVEALAIVLCVCFLSLGARAGVVVTFCIPLIVAALFACMNYTGIYLHRVSLGALIIALGLLVDDAIISIEMMLVKMEQGWDKAKAASFSFAQTALPRLVGALVTCAGFMPVGFSVGAASEFVGSIFWVVTISLMISWVVAGTVTPLLGCRLIQLKKTAGGQHEFNLYNTRFYRLFRRVLEGALRVRWLVIALAVAAFILSIQLMNYIPKEFFPNSTRPELIVDMRLPEGSSLKATEQEAAKLAEKLKDDPRIVNFSSYTRTSAPRFVLSVAGLPQDNANYAQFVILAKDTKARDELRRELEELFDREFENVRMKTKVLALGPGSAYPVMLRVSGYDRDKVREIASQARDIMVQNPNLLNINFNWFEKTKTMRLHIDQDKARALGIDKQSLAVALQSKLSGIPIAEFREGDKKIDIVYRAADLDPNDLSRVKDLSVAAGAGKFVPLGQIAEISYGAEEGTVWRRNLKPTIDIQADTVPGITGNDATIQAYQDLEELRKNLPPGYSIEMGGSVELRDEGIGLLMQPVPAMVVIIMTLLMLQLQSIPKMILVLLTAPLGIIGVSAAMLLFQKPMGFVAIFGIMALCGMIIRNSIILIDQIEKLIAEGLPAWDAIINATISRFRPIMLTAAAAILAMIPLSGSAFWGPMATAIGGGLLGATVLTLLVFPAMYAAWFKVKPVLEEKK